MQEGTKNGSEEKTDQSDSETTEFEKEKQIGEKEKEKKTDNPEKSDKSGQKVVEKEKEVTLVLIDLIIICFSMTFCFSIL